MQHILFKKYWHVYFCWNLHIWFIWKFIIKKIDLITYCLKIHGNTCELKFWRWHYHPIMSHFQNMDAMFQIWKNIILIKESGPAPWGSWLLLLWMHPQVEICSICLGSNHANKGHTYPFRPMFSQKIQEYSWNYLSLRKKSAKFC